MASVAPTKRKPPKPVVTAQRDGRSAVFCFRESLIAWLTCSVGRKDMPMNAHPESRIFVLCLGLLLLSSCASPAPQLVVAKPAVEKKDEQLTLDAALTRKDGKIKARLVRGTGNKEIDDAIIIILEGTADNYPNLKEGESITVQVDPIKQ